MQKYLSMVATARVLSLLWLCPCQTVGWCSSVSHAFNLLFELSYPSQYLLVPNGSQKEDNEEHEANSLGHSSLALSTM